uniref:Uncharacterized protein n=1 Tax=Neogobius melanostomus TaxID=47308 RepID=A0A8C6WUS2_9GOBI
MLDVLTRYKSFVKIVAEFKSCPSAHKMNQVLKDLHDDMTKCFKKDLGLKGTWDEGLLCDYLMERLFSFSILTARVFYLGDPAKHAEPTGPACALRN